MTDGSFEMQSTGDGNLLFLGAGNMAEALVKGILAGDVWPVERIRVTDVAPERLALFENAYGVGGSSDNASEVSRAAVLFLSVKPQAMAEALRGVANAVRPGTRIVSIAAGVRTERIEAILGEGARVVRSMPNTPALVRAGVSAICGGRWACEEDLALAERLLGAVGRVVRVREADMDAVTAVSGSGPAYAFLLMECMIEAGVRMGLSAEVAAALATDTVAGAGRLAVETGLAPAELRHRVTSKGGTTAAALSVLDDRGVRAAFVGAMEAARARSIELSS